MKALQVEYGKGHIHKPPEKWEIRKWTALSPKDSLVTKNKQLCSALSGGCLPSIFVSSQKYIPTSLVKRHFIGRTIQNEAMKSLCGKRSQHPKTVTAWTSLLGDERFILLLKQLTMNAVWLNTTKCSKAIIMQSWMNQNLHSTLPLKTS